MRVGPRINRDHPLRRLFAGLVENAFCTEVGLCDPELNDYVADLLVEFTHIDRYRAISHSHGKRLEQIAGMLAILAEDRPSSRQALDRVAYRHIGDYAMFWAGVYPEQLKQALPGQSDVLLSYVTQGKRSYAIVSDLTSDEDTLPSSLFRHLSEDFEHCLYGLGLVRRSWEDADPGGGRLVL